MNITDPHREFRCQCFNTLRIILFFIGDDEVRPQIANPIELKVFGAANTHLFKSPLIWVDAKTRQANDFIVNVQIGE